VAGTLVLASVLLAVLAGCAGAPGEGSGRAATAPEETAGRRTTEGVSVDQDRMSLREAVGQMFVVGMSGTEPDYYIEKMIRERNVGGVLLFRYNMQDEAQTRALVSDLQRLSLETEPSVPMFVAVDQEGGAISPAPWVTPQPSAAEIGAHGDPSKARAVAEQMGRELRRAGINTDFAPVVDTGFGAAIGERSFGEDPETVSRMGAAAVAGFEAAGVISSAKHFPNHGVAVADSHLELPVVDHDLATVRSYDMPPFRAAVEAGVPMVMVGHLVYPALDPKRPASLSPAAIRTLREELGFDGVVVTDDLAMAGASRGGAPARAAVEAVEAGADMLVISSPPQEQADAYDAVVAAVESGEIPRRRIHASAERILKVKQGYRLREGTRH
jgi:beta-N-acetylhexosaminidase